MDDMPFARFIANAQQFAMTRRDILLSLYLPLWIEMYENGLTPEEAAHKAISLQGDDRTEADR